MRIDLYLYFDASFERDDIEDALDERLGDVGFVSGAGWGGEFCNLDIEVPEHGDKRRALEIIKKVLEDFEVRARTTVYTTDEGDRDVPLDELLSRTT